MVETASVVAGLVVLAGVAGVPVAAITGGPADTQVAANGTANGSVAPGERFAGVVGVEKAAVQSEVAERAFGQRIATANSNASRARVVGAELEQLQARLGELQAERAELETAHENGSISTGQYRARLAQLHAEERALQRLANRTEAVAMDLPSETLEANGVDVTAIRTLRADAANLTGPEVAEIARGIAGKRAGQGLGPERAGPPAFAGNGTAGERGPPGDGGPPDDAGPQGENRTGAGGPNGGNGGGPGQGQGGPPADGTDRSERDAVPPASIAIRP